MQSRGLSQSVQDAGYLCYRPAQAESLLGLTFCTQLGVGVWGFLCICLRFFQYWQVLVMVDVWPLFEAAITQPNAQLIAL